MNPERIKALSDGVFAVAITLLVLQFQVPHVPASQLAGALLKLWPELASYVLSFAVVGVYWVAHWNVIHELHSGDRNFAWINIGFLACVAFIPFPAALVGAYGAERSAVILYGATLVVTGLMLRAVFVYAIRKRLIDAPPGLERYAMIRQVVPIAIYSTGLLLAIAAPALALAMYVCVPLLYIIPSPYSAGRPVAPRSSRP
ncbi:MAG: TMEM175 family protein [Candidatus Dormibacteraeota bacterium]|nr:TMEM175 family protein [Candidatus Dormibacteraeota bacterium]